MDTKIHPTIRHSKCALILAESSESKCCCECQKYRKTLHSMLSRQHKTCSSLSKTAPNSHVNYWYLSTTETDHQLERLHKLQRTTKHQVDRLSAKIAENIEQKGLMVDESMHNDLTQIVNDQTSKVNATYPDDCFQKLFWMQQKKASALTNARSMRWHPLMIKWCLYLRRICLAGLMRC